MTDPPIQQLGPYRILRVVGRGGMGSVFAAVHEHTEERSAIKVLAPALAADDSFRERFIAEIESLKTLNHPHIVKLHGYGEADGHLYYAMELVEGTTLEHEIAAGRRFNWREVTQIGIDVARALKHAHDHGVIHRDLKPANLLVDGHDHIKLTDFGIAKLFGANRVTYSGGVLGTADYMSPEQAAGEPTTPRCDLYSLGCVMYALLAGNPPFRGETIAEVVHKVRYEQPPPLSKYVSDIPRDLAQIIDELLEKDPEERVRTALSLTHRLRAIQQALSISTTGEDEFSSDSLDKEPPDRTNRIVNPPPDIAERPTVFLPPNESAPTEKNTIARRSQKRSEKRNRLDHFTRVELDHPRLAESGRVNEFSSALPLILMLLIVLGMLMLGVWYTARPLSADDLYARIMSAAGDPTSRLSVANDVNRFMAKFPDDNRIESVRDLQEEIAIQNLQRTLEIRARGRKETGKLSPVEVHCNDAFRAYREGNVERAIQNLEGIQKMYGSDLNQTDIGIQRILQLASRLLPQWREELDAEITGLEASAWVYRDRARSLQDEEPHRAREIWQGIIDLHRDRPWAADLVAEARQAITQLDSKTQEKTNQSTPNQQPEMEPNDDQT